MIRHHRTNESIILLLELLNVEYEPSAFEYNYYIYRLTNAVD